MFIGVHPNDSGGIDMAVRRAAGAGAKALQIFSAKPQFYNEKISVRPERVEKFHATMRENHLEAKHCLVHAAYVLNLASTDMDKYERSTIALTKELSRTTALGAFACCFHPGSAGEGEAEDALERVGDAIVQAIEGAPGNARVLIENTAGAGRTMGRTPGELATMLRRVPSRLRSRTGYGLDTCHLFASGLDFTSSPKAAKGLLDAFCDATGEAPSFFHFNDSEGGFGSNRDRHALVGKGQVGLEPFRWLLADERVRAVPVILETPHLRETVDDGDPSADPNDVAMVELLTVLAR